MKTKLFKYVILALIMMACDSATLEIKKDEDSSNQNGFNASTSMFEGTWTWLETHGVDFDGVHYRQDSISEGYSIRYKFYATDGESGKLQTFKDLRTDVLYLYEYTKSENNPLQKKMILDRMTNSAPEIYYWEITFKQKEKGESIEGHLYLRNAQYFTDGCCDGKIEMHFVLTEAPNL